MADRRFYSEPLLEALDALEPPVLIVSTVVGRGMYSIGEAVHGLLAPQKEAWHVPVEELLDGGAVNEDYERYKIISNRYPFLLYIVYKFPLIYYRKLLREKLFQKADLSRISDVVAARRIKSVVCISHRPAFWLSAFKRRTGAGFSLWGLLGEYGRTLGWKYIFWDVVNGYLSPLTEREPDFPFPPDLQFYSIDLPAREVFYKIRDIPPDKNKALLVAGFWGQGFFTKAIQGLNGQLPQLGLHVVCGENKDMLACLQKDFGGNSAVTLHGRVENLAELMSQCASVISKPGISTIVEARAARRALFLLKGMPVAEDNNAHHAIKHFNAQWFSLRRFVEWHQAAVR